MYVIATQEAAWPTPESEDKWFQVLVDYLGAEYLSLASMGLWDMNIVVIMRKRHLLKVANVEGATRATLLQQIVGSKGGVAISLTLQATSIAFVGVHLPSRAERSVLRNTTLVEIFDGLNVGNADFDFLGQFDHVVLLGDLGYTVENDTDEVMSLASRRQYRDILEHDQLSTLLGVKHILNGFVEAPVAFAPTFKVTRDGDYTPEKRFVPSYTDRVLWSSANCGAADKALVPLTYTSATEVRLSEHVPVACVFQLRCLRVFCGALQRPTLRPMSVAVTSFSISELIDGVVLNKPRLTFQPSDWAEVFQTRALRGPSKAPLSWVRKDLPVFVLHSMTLFPEYLRVQTLRIAVRDDSEKPATLTPAGTALSCVGSVCVHMSRVLESPSRFFVSVFGGV